MLHYYVNYVICGFWTGWRPNEACALKWQRVDFQQGKILIREGRVLGQTGIPKSAGQPAGHRHAGPGTGGFAGPEGPSAGCWGSYVFLDPKQQPVNQELFRQKVWEPVLKRLGIRYRPPYQMRHTFATLAISAGENINWVARMLGHKSPVMTLERYNRFVPNLTREDGKALLGTSEMAKRFAASRNNLCSNINKLSAVLVVPTGIEPVSPP